MPWIGKLFTGHREAYTYLPESIRKFPLQEELSAKLREIGFTEVSYRNLTNGIAVIHQGRKAGGGEPGAGSGGLGVGNNKHGGKDRKRRMRAERMAHSVGKNKKTLLASLP